MSRIVRASIPLIAVALLTATPAWADGLGGLSALRGILYATIGFVAIVWIAVWLVARDVSLARGPERDTSSQPEATRRDWLFDPAFPIGLRVLRVLQYVLAFPYACSGLLRLMMPAAYHNDHIAEWVLQWIAFCAGFTALAITSANAYSKKGDPRGFNLAVALGWLCVANAIVGTLWHGPYEGFDPISATFGLVLLAAMQFRYRRWFGCEMSRPWVRRLAHRAGVFAGSWAAVVAGLIVLSWIMTGPLEHDEDEASARLKTVSEAMRDYYDEHGDWPEDLRALPPDVALTYRWKHVQYDRDEPRIYFDVRIGINPSPI